MDLNFIHKIATQAQEAVKRANAVAAQLRGMNEMMKKGEEMTVQRFSELEKLLAGKKPTYAERIVACAEHVVPFFYTIEVDFAANATARTPGSVNIDQDGYFLVDRYYACWIVTQAVANAGEWKPVSSAAIAGDEAVAGADVADKMDFMWEIVEGSSQRARQNTAIPGDILYRSDGDGVLTEPDVLPPASTLTAYITPTQAVDHDGTFYLVAQGRQCLNVIEDAV